MARNSCWHEKKEKSPGLTPWNGALRPPQGGKTNNKSFIGLRDKHKQKKDEKEKR